METARHYKERIDEARAAIMRGPVFDAKRWSQLSEDEQKHLVHRITIVQDELLAKKRVKQAKPSSYRLDSEDGPKHLLLWLTLFGFVFAATLLSLVH